MKKVYACETCGIEFEQKDDCQFLCDDCCDANEVFEESRGEPQ